MTTKNQAGKGNRRQREEVDVFADMMQAGAFSGEEGGEHGDFVEAFTSAVASPTAPGSLAARLAQEYGFKPSKEQSFDIPVERVLDSSYQQRLDKSLWTEKQRREYERLRTAVREGLNEVFFVAPYPGRPGYFFLAYGGHNRRDAAREEGYTTIPCIIVAYEQENGQDEERVGFGTTFENEVKIPMTLEERGRLYRQLMQRFKLSQEKLGKRLDLTRDIVKDCLMVAESAEDIRELVRDLSEGSGVRIARALGRLERLRETFNNEEAPQMARVPLIKAYRTGEMKTELIEAYIEEILRLVQESGITSLEEILHQVFHPRQAEAERVTAAPERKQPQDLEVASPVPALQMAATNVEAAQLTRSEVPTSPVAEREERGDHTAFTAAVVPVSTGVAESAQRIDKLLKAQKYLKAYRKLAAGTNKGEQEVRILDDMDDDIQAEKAKQTGNI